MFVLPLSSPLLAISISRLDDVCAEGGTGEAASLSTEGVSGSEVVDDVVTIGVELVGWVDNVLVELVAESSCR